MNSVVVLDSDGRVNFKSNMPLPAKPSYNQVIIYVDTCILTGIDIDYMRGFSNLDHQYPFTPRLEGSGTVVEAGSSTLAQAYVGKRVAFSIAN